MVISTHLMWRLLALVQLPIILILYVKLRSSQRIDLISENYSNIIQSLKQQSISLGNVHVHSKRLAEDGDGDGDADISPLEGGLVENEKLIRSQDQQKLFPCNDYTLPNYPRKRGSYWVLYNYFKATRNFRCDQSITFTTHADWTFLDNLEPLLERWQGPVSIAIHSPGTDFDESVKRIRYLRECANDGSGPNLIKKFVTFHLFFHQDHMPDVNIPAEQEEHPVDCDSLLSTISLRKGEPTYKQLMNLTYPINVARNVAKEMSTTYYVLPCDIELYPSPNLIRDFMKMIKLNGPALQRPGPKVFVLSHFEVEANITELPKDKVELVKLLESKRAIPFHKDLCPRCHSIPNASEWKQAPVGSGLGVFHISHRDENRWEPFHIGTKFDPGYEEILTWEGQSDKILQSYLLCVFGYEFHILDNAFLVHKPGIKVRDPKSLATNRTIEARLKQYDVIDYIILPQLDKIYGTRTGCGL